MRAAGITTRENANRYLVDYLPRHNHHFAVPATEPGTAFVPYTGSDLDKIFSKHWERIIANDNTLSVGKRRLQIERQTFRFSMAKCRVLVCEHLDGTITVHYGPHQVGRYDHDGTPIPVSAAKLSAA